MKKIVSLVVLLSLLISVCACGSMGKTSPVEDFEYEMEDGEVIITGYKGTDREIYIPEKINGRDVTTIGEEAFAEYDLTHVTISKTVTTVEDYAFQHCTCLVSVELPKHLNKLGEYAFYGCTDLEKIELPKELEVICSGAFEDCTALTSIKIPDSVIELQDDIFRDCTDLEKVAFTNNITVLGDGIFAECTALKEVDFPNGFDNIACAMFLNCTSLSKVNLPDTLTNIGVNAFMGCESLYEIDLPEGLKTIETGAFGDCYNLEYLYIPEGTTSIAYDVSSKDVFSGNRVVFTGDKEEMETPIGTYKKEETILGNMDSQPTQYTVIAVKEGSSDHDLLKKYANQFNTEYAIY